MIRSPSAWSVFARNLRIFRRRACPTSASERKSGATRRLVRGDVKSPAEEVSPGGLSCLKQAGADFGLPPDAPEAQRRLKLAEWMMDPRNPLTARVMANRLWHYHFGQGIVATPSDFGFNGDRPSHPELLDYLAMTFVRGDWSLKHLHKLMVTSAVYRQSAANRPEAAARDGDNRLLWRFNSRRLEGEAVRDAMLRVSGQLNSAMGGPSFRPFEVTTHGSDFYHLKDKIGEAVQSADDLPDQRELGEESADGRARLPRSVGQDAAAASHHDAACRRWR